MITVTVIDTGDEAEAETPEAAVTAALTLGWEAKRHVAIQGFDPLIKFTVDGAIVRSTTLRALTRFPLKEGA